MVGVVLHLEVKLLFVVKISDFDLHVHQFSCTCMYVDFFADSSTLFLLERGSIITPYKNHIFI